MNTGWLISRLFILPGILIGISFHEFAHAFVANKLGDPTAKEHGRLTIEPWAHVDLFGFIFFILAGFGWAKPVPVNTANFKKPNFYEVLVSIAGPIMNFLLATIFTIILVLIDKAGIGLEYKNIDIIYLLLYFAIQINVLLGIFNLFPIPPLDGSHILYNILPKSWKHKYMRIYELQGIILLVLLLTNVLDYILYIPTTYVTQWLLEIGYTILG